MLNVVNETIYESEHKFFKAPPPTRFHNYVSFVVNTPGKLIPRCFPHSLRISPHRILKFERSTLGFGPTGEYELPKSRKKISKAASDKTKSSSGEKAKGGSRNSPRSEFGSEKSEDHFKKEDLEDKEETEENYREISKNLSKVAFSQRERKMIRNLIYKTTAKRVTEECALPVLVQPTVLPQILGTNEDKKLYHSVFPRNDRWKAKTTQEGWDRFQERPMCEVSKKYQPSRLHLSPSKSNLLPWRPQQTRDFVISQKLRKSKTQEGMTRCITSTDAHVRPVPGYGGFVPRLPKLSIPTRDPRVTLSSSAASYRNFPSLELRIPDHAHKGPLSNLVTTTSPCNPFKKGLICPDHLIVH